MGGRRGGGREGVEGVEGVECSLHTKHYAEASLMHTHGSSLSQACRCWQQCCTCCTRWRRIK